MESQAGSIGHIVRTYLFRTENWIYNQIRFQTNYPSIILASRLDKQEQFAHERVFALQALPFWRWVIEHGLRKYIIGYSPYHYQIAKNHGVRLLQAHFGDIGINSLPLANVLGVPLVTAFYGADMSLQHESDERLESKYAPLFEGGELFLVEGPAARTQLESIGCPREKIRIRLLGVDLEEIPFRPRQVAEDAPIRILMAATFTEKKGMSFGVEAFCQAAQENQRLRLTVVGNARPSQPEEEEIKSKLNELVDKYKMNSRVEFLGYVPIEQLRRLSYEHHIFLHPSVTASTGDREGGSPVVITEMVASGLPVISTHHCDIPQVVLDNKTGLLTDERNVEQLFLALLQLAADDGLRMQMAIDGREHVAKNFSARRQGNLLGEIYRDVLELDKISV